MVKFYVRRILIDKKMTIDEVPMRWRAKEQEEIEEWFKIHKNQVINK